MAPRYRIKFARVAERHLAEIAEYVSGSSPQAAGRVIRNLLTAIETLRDLPHRYRVLQDVRSFGVGTRSLVVKPYLVRYRIDEKGFVVNVISIRHGARRPGL